MSWETLRPVLLELSSREPGPLRHYPDPRVAGGRRIPFRISLAPWAESVAATLHEEFGDEVVLCVGNFGYPDRVWVDGLGRPREPSGPARSSEHPGDEELADPRQMTVDLCEDVVVASGHDIATELAVFNSTSTPLALRRLRAEIVDLQSGACVGGSMAGFNALVPAYYPIGPRRSGIVPLRVGTASSDPEVGYAVPPGSWALRVFLPVVNGPTLRAPLLSIEIT